MGVGRKRLYFVVANGVVVNVTVIVLEQVGKMGAISR